MHVLRRRRRHRCRPGISTATILYPRSGNPLASPSFDRTSSECRQDLIPTCSPFFATLYVTQCYPLRRWLTQKTGVVRRRGSRRWCRWCFELSEGTRCYAAQTHHVETLSRRDPDTGGVRGVSSRCGRGWSLWRAVQGATIDALLRVLLAVLCFSGGAGGRPSRVKLPYHSRQRHRI